jgi:DNA-binding CsgD family transcriptional regulator
MAVHTQALELIGRDEELARIDAFLIGSGAGGAALVFEGEAGIGKTTLWLASVERARESGFRVLVARPAEAERELSFATLGDLLADVHEQIRRLPPPQGRPLARALLLEEAPGAPVEPRAVAIALLATLRAVARERPLLVAVDDVQWVDAPSAMALSFALRRAVEGPVAVLLARRTGPGHESRVELDRSLSIERVVAGPLSLGALRQLLQDRLEGTFPRPILRRIHERSGGNPFFALELGRALTARGKRLSPQEELPVPDDLERLLAERLNLLPPETKEPLAAVAALGEPTRELTDEPALEPAFAAGVLVLDRDRIRFAHPLLAAAAYCALSPICRRALHRRLAQLVADDEERARHLALGAEGPDPALAAVLDEAALRARVRGAPGAAADLAHWALRLGERDRQAAVRRIVAAAEYRAAAGDHAEARKLVEDALAEEPNGADRGRLLLQRARLGDLPIDAGIECLKDALGNAGGDLALEAWVLADLTQWTANARRIPDAEPHARRSVELAERLGEATLLAGALTQLAWTEFSLGRGLSVELMERALELDPLCESMRINRRPTAAFAHMCMWSGDLHRSRALLDRARAIAHEEEDLTADGLIRLTAALEFLADDWRLSLEAVDELYDLGVEAELETTVITALSERGLLFALLGDEERTRRAVAEALVLDERQGSRWVPRIGGWALALLDLSLDNPRAALAHAREATADPRDEGVEEPALIPAFPEYAEAAIAAGELQEAGALLDWVEERAARLDRAWALACVGRCRGLLAAARGDEAGAVVAFGRALAEHDRVQGRRFDLARTQLARGEALRRFKKKRAAREAIEAAAAIFDELGAKLWSAKARRELARIGGRTGAPGLTETERRVAALVAAGRSNKEAAGELFVTVRTIETHLTKIYAKLDVRSRTELARRLTR